MAAPKKTSESVIASATVGTDEGALSAASKTEARRENMTLEAALAALDPDNDEHWNQDGSPKIAVLEDLTGGDVAKADLPEGFSRAKARGLMPNPDLPPDEKKPSLEDRVAAVEQDLGYLRNQFGWPTKAS